MKVKEMLEILNSVPEEANVSIIYPEDCYVEESGVRIDEIMYLKSSSADSKKNGVFIKIG